jgi:glycosyltransferase involved in cell wall biosynthesis
VVIVPNFPLKKSLPKESRRQLRVDLGLPLDRIIVSFVGMLRQDYALPELLLAAEKLNGVGGVVFLFVGYGPLKESIYGMIRGSAVSELFVLREKVSRADALRYIKASDYSYVVLRDTGVNTKFGSPWKLFESLALGTKLIVGGGTFAASYARRGVDVVVDTVDADGVFKALLTLSKGDTLSTKEFFWERWEDRLLNIYRSL